VKAAAGIARERRLPPLARGTFRSWFGRRTAARGEGPRVILWPDTFNDHFHPETARAAVDVLEAAGFRVAIPPRPLCCGRPLYDWGMLGRARSLLRQVLRTMQPEIAAGTPVVVLEPSCLAVFRDEALNLLADDHDARRFARQCLSLAEFLDREAPQAVLPRVERRALVHGHCHQKAVMGLGSDVRVLDRLGLRYELLDSGCCGMAGAFGFEKDKYDLSVQIGERVLLPAVRGAAADALILSDGFSCREQVAQGTGRRASHLAEVIAGALPGRASGASA
jgi:Fe-S oxidoreductase